jgi:Uma2 family endonuclease
MSSPATPLRTATAEDLARLPPDARVEIIDGQIVEKTAPSAEHAAAQADLVVQLGPFRRRGGSDAGGWWILTELEVEYDRPQVYRHDVVGFRRETTPRRPSGTPVRVRPDWVAEILSPRNASNDLVKKMRTLHQHGVPHYWVIDPESRALLVHRWTADGHLTVLAAGDGDVVRAEPFEAVEIHLDWLFEEE